MEIQKLKLLVSTIQKLSLARDINTVTSVVRTAARELTGADGATFVLKDNDKCYYADEDAIAPLWKGQRFPLSACVSGWAMINKKWVTIEDIYKDERIPIEAYRPTFVKSLAMVPIRTMEPIGAIGNYWAKQHAPTLEEMELLQTLADITSVSIENVYAFNELKEQNKKLYEIAFMQSHQVRVPIAQIQGLFNLFDFENPKHPNNPEIFKKLKVTVDSFDGIIKDITQLTSKIKMSES
jgi:GAF domain-containing protein